MQTATSKHVSKVYILLISLTFIFVQTYSQSSNFTQLAQNNAEALKDSPKWSISTILATVASIILCIIVIFIVLFVIGGIRFAGMLKKAGEEYIKEDAAFYYVIDDRVNAIRTSDESEAELKKRYSGCKIFQSREKAMIGLIQLELAETNAKKAANILSPTLIENASAKVKFLTDVIAKYDTLLAAKNTTTRSK